jgi:alpha-ketoglutarate-dependent taurine dioxygenase
MQVALLASRSFGCEITGLHLPSALADGELSEPLLRAFLEAFNRHGLVVLRGQQGLRPEHEAAIYRQLGRYWTNRADINAEPNEAGPGGFSEIGVIGQEEFDAQMKMGSKSHEYDNMEWHTDGPTAVGRIAVCQYLACYSSPSECPSGELRWPAQDGEDEREHVLRFPAGSTLFASGYDAYERSTEAEQQKMLALQARYSRGWGSLANSGGGSDSDEAEDDIVVERDSDDGFSSTAPVMDGSGTRRMQKPWYANDEDNAARFNCVLPLVLRHPQTGRHSVLCEPIAMVQLEPLAPGDGSDALSWDESHDLVSRAWRRATVPDRVLVWDWSPGDAIFWDSRCILHSRTPYMLYAPDESEESGGVGIRGERLMHNMRISVDLDEAGVLARSARL